MRIFEWNDDVLIGDNFDLMSESLLALFGEQTVVKTNSGNWNLFDKPLQQSGVLLLTDGDITNKWLSLASAYCYI